MPKKKKVASNRIKNVVILNKFVYPLPLGSEVTCVFKQNLNIHSLI